MIEEKTLFLLRKIYLKEEKLKDPKKIKDLENIRYLLKKLSTFIQLSKDLNEADLSLLKKYVSRID